MDFLPDKNVSWIVRGGPTPLQFFAFNAVRLQKEIRVLLPVVPVSRGLGLAVTSQRKGPGIPLARLWTTRDT